MKSAVLAAFVAAASAQQSYISYSTVTGYFLQDLATTNTSGFDYTAVNFGLINQTYPGVSSTGRTQWQQFRQVVEELNDNTPDDTVYKLFWLGRHGEGYHNAAESFYGTPAWNCYWSELDGNATATWADADLTPNGVRQAQIANAFWKSEIANQKIPFPQAYYTSPLTRCLRTANLTFADIPTPKYYPFVPKVKEFFREGISTHTCDRRSNKTYIHNRFPTYTFEDGFTEKDELWNVNYAETSAAQDIRSKAALDSVFTADDHTYVSITSHSGEIASLLRVLGHRAFSLSTGAVIPVLVKGVFLPAASAPAVSSAPARTSSAYCLNAPPVTSISGGACVCSGASTGLISSSTRTASGAASTGAVGSKTSTLSAQITGSAGVSKSGALPSGVSTTKPKVCKSKSKATKKSKSKSAASTGGAKASSSNSRVASTGGVKPSSTSSKAGTTGVTKSAVLPSGASTSKPLACKSKSKKTKKSKSKSAASTGAVKPSSSNSKAASTGVVKSSSSKSAISSGAVRSSSSLSSTSKPAGTTGAVRSSSSNSKPAASAGKASSSKPKVCKTRSKTKTLSASTGGAVKPSSTSSGAKPTTGAVRTSTLSTSIIRSGSSGSAGAVKSSSSTSTTCTANKGTSTLAAVVKSSSSAAVKSTSAGPVQSSSSAVKPSSSAPASSKSSSASSAKPSSTAISSKTSAASSTITSGASRASVNLSSTSKAKVCKTRTYASYYNEYKP